MSMKFRETFIRIGRIVANFIQKTMKKEIAKIKLQCVGGQANPAPPIGPALGQHGVNIVELIDVVRDPLTKTPAIITEFVDTSDTDFRKLY